MTTQQARCVHDQPRTTDRYLRMGRKAHDAGQCGVRGWLETLAACEERRNGRPSALGSRSSGESRFMLGSNPVGSWQGSTQMTNVMRSRLGIITLGVENLQASLKFYRDGLGLKSKGIIGEQWEHGAIVLFELEGGMALSLFPRADLALDAKIEKGPPSATEFSIGHNVASEAEVDRIMKLAEKAGARITVPPEKKFWGGYSGYFQDPDGHLWEILYNPDFLPT
jgi:catechol 2,3-dioxygenase-like lactoylglutathione lyase family enzyme